VIAPESFCLPGRRASSRNALAIGIRFSYDSSTLERGVIPTRFFRELFEQAREAAGIMEWPENALRHSFASYHLAHFKNAASTALELGHHDSRLTFAHYRELVKPREAERYWNIMPATTEKVVPLSRDFKAK